MQSNKQRKQSLWETFVDKYFNTPSIIASDTGDFSLASAPAFIHEPGRNFSALSIENYDSNPTFSSYFVEYHIGGGKGQAVYAATSTTYPDLASSDTVDEYEMSFSLND